MHLGLSSEEYRVLTNNVTDFFHAAAISYTGVDDKTARRVNIDGTINVLEFAADVKNLRRFNHFSSAFVSGDRTGVVTEDELDCGQGFTDHIQKTKLLAEKEVRKAMSSLPISVYRPSMIVGKSASGEADKLEGFYSFVKMVIAPGFNVPMLVPKRGMVPLNIVPVDFVVQAALHISAEESSAGKTFHVVDPNPLTVKQVLSILAEKSGNENPHIITMPTRIAQMLPKIKRIANLAPAYMNAIGVLDRFTIYNCANTVTAMKGSGIICPSFGSYADKMVGFVQTQLSKKTVVEAEQSLKDPLA